MASVARFDGTGYFDVSIPAGTSTTWTWRAQIQADSARAGLASFYYLIGQAGNTSNQFVVEDLDNNPPTKNCDSRAQSQNLNLSCPNADFASSPTLIEIVANGSGAELFIDGVSQNTDTSVTTVSQISEYIGRANASISDPFDLYYLEYEEDGVVEHRWVPPADGLGTTMTDTGNTGGADATATGFAGNPFVPISTTTIIDTVKGLATGVSAESSETGIAFTYSNDDPESMQIGSDDGAGNIKALDIAFTASGGSGTVAMPSLSTTAGFPYFTDATATPAITTFLRATTTEGVDDFDLTFTVEAPYVVVTMDAAALAASVGNPARIDASWSTKLVAGEQILLDSNIATIDTGAVLTIVTIDPTFTSTAYAIDDTGMEAFTVSDSGEGDTHVTGGSKTINVPFTDWSGSSNPIAEFDANDQGSLGTNGVMSFFGGAVSRPNVLIPNGGGEYGWRNTFAATADPSNRPANTESRYQITQPSDEFWIYYRVFQPGNFEHRSVLYAETSSVIGDFSGWIQGDTLTNLDNAATCSFYYAGDETTERRIYVNNSSEAFVENLFPVGNTIRNDRTLETFVVTGRNFISSNNKFATMWCGDAQQPNEGYENGAFTVQFRGSSQAGSFFPSGRLNPSLAASDAQTANGDVENLLPNPPYDPFLLFDTANNGSFIEVVEYRKRSSSSTVANGGYRVWANTGTTNGWELVFENLQQKAFSTQANNQFNYGYLMGFSNSGYEEETNFYWNKVRLYDQKPDFLP